MLLRHFQVFFSVAGENIICSFFPARHTRKFPSQLDRSGWFPSQEFRALSNPSIRNDRTRATKPGQNRFFSASAVTLTSRPYVCGVPFFFFKVVLSLQRFLQPARVEMLKKVSNSQAKRLSITKFSQPAHRNTCIFASQQDSSWEQIMWGTDSLGAPVDSIIMQYFWGHFLLLWSKQPWTVFLSV